MSADPAHSSGEFSIPEASRAPNGHCTGQSIPFEFAAKAPQYGISVPQSSVSRSSGSLGTHGTRTLGLHVADSWETQQQQPPQQQAPGSDTPNPKSPQKQCQHWHQQEHLQQREQAAEQDAQPQAASQAAPRRSHLKGASRGRPWAIIGLKHRKQAQRFKGGNPLPPRYHGSYGTSSQRRGQILLPPPSRLSMVRIQLLDFGKLPTARYHLCRHDKFRRISS